MLRMFDFIAFPIGKILKFIYDTIAFQNYGFAIILLTVGIKLILMPLSIKQVDSASKISEFQPEIQKIQMKYGNDKEKLGQETMKFYKENKINPAGGCLPVIIQMPILFSLYYVISQPLKYMIGKSVDTIAILYDKIPAGSDRIPNMSDLSIITYFSKHQEELANVNSLLKKEELLNMNFMGINLGSIPTLDYHSLFLDKLGVDNLLLLIIPILAVVTTYISFKYSMQQVPTQITTETGDNQMQSSIQKNMAFISPLMTGIISFTVPAGMGLYWIIGNVFQIFQQMFMNKFIIKNNSNAGMIKMRERENFATRYLKFNKKM